MTIAVLIILLLAAAGAAASLVAARAQSRREARAAQAQAELEAERQLVVQRPREYIAREGMHHRANVTPWLHRQGVAQRDLDVRVRPLTAEGGAPWSGVALILRVLAAVVVTLLFALSAVLNVEIFVALNGGNPSVAAVAKGIGASLLELVLAVVAAHLIRHRELRSAAWQARFWAVLALLAITVVFVYHYAPARSQQAIGPTVALDERLLRQAETTRLPDGQLDTQAISAAVRTLEDDKKRLQEAENSDQAQSILFPLVEVLAGELALEGGVALVALARLHRHRRDADEAQRVKDHLDATIAAEEQTAIARVVAALVAAGHEGVLDLMDTANARGGATPQALTVPADAPAHPPTAGNSPPANSSEPAEGGGGPDGAAAPPGPPIDLDVLHNAPHATGHANASFDPSAEPSPGTRPASGGASGTYRWDLAD